MKSIKFCLTGELDSNSARDLIRSKGHEIQPNVTKDLDYLVVLDHSSSKVIKAKDLGVTLLTYCQLKELLDY